jgi:hypothetical protein
VACKLDSERSQKCHNKNDRAGARFHVSNETKSNWSVKLSPAPVGASGSPAYQSLKLTRVFV